MSPITRRQLLAGSAAGLSLVGARRAGAATSLRLLCWPAYDDADVSEGFRQANQAVVHANHIGANDEIFTFLRAGGVRTYDVVTPGNGFVQPLARAGLIQPLDPERLPSAATLISQFQSPAWAMVDGELYGLPLSWHTYPMIYNAGAIDSPPAAWTDLADPRFKGRIVMIDDVISHFTIWNRALGAADPTRVTRDELERTTDLLEIKRDLALAYVGGLSDVANRLAHAGGWVTTTGQEVITTLPAADGADLRMARPAPGDFSVCDCLSIPAHAPNLDLAYAYLDHMISAEAQATLATKRMRATVSADAVELLDDDLKALVQYNDLDATFAVSPLVGFPPLEADTGDVANYVDWVLAWDRVRFTPLDALKPPTPTPEPSPASEGDPPDAT